jgi:hypothetical protein
VRETHTRALDLTELLELENNSKIQVMNNSSTQNQRIAKMTFASVYPLYLSKVEERQNKRGIASGHRVVNWLRQQEAAGR